MFVSFFQCEGGASLRPKSPGADESNPGLAPPTHPSSVVDDPRKSPLWLLLRNNDETRARRPEHAKSSESAGSTT